MVKQYAENGKCQKEEHQADTTKDVYTETIGACRAVWVPGQDLATPHLMRNCGKRILSLHCTLYVRLCVPHLSRKITYLVRKQI